MKNNIGRFVLPLALVAMVGVNAMQWAPAAAAAVAPGAPVTITAPSSTTVEEAIGKLRDAQSALDRSRSEVASAGTLVQQAMERLNSASKSPTPVVSIPNDEFPSSRQACCDE